MHLLVKLLGFVFGFGSACVLVCFVVFESICSHKYLNNLFGIQSL